MHAQGYGAVPTGDVLRQGVLAGPVLRSQGSHWGARPASVPAVNAMPAGAGVGVGVGVGVGLGGGVAAGHAVPSAERGGIAGSAGASSHTWEDGAMAAGRQAATRPRTAEPLRRGGGANGAQAQGLQAAATVADALRLRAPDAAQRGGQRAAALQGQAEVEAAMPTPIAVRQLRASHGLDRDEARGRRGSVVAAAPSRGGPDAARVPSHVSVSGPALVGAGSAVLHRPFSAPQHRAALPRHVIGEAPKTYKRPSSRILREPDPLRPSPSRREPRALNPRLTIAMAPSAQAVAAGAASPRARQAAAHSPNTSLHKSPVSPRKNKSARSSTQSPGSAGSASNRRGKGAASPARDVRPRGPGVSSQGIGLHFPNDDAEAPPGGARENGGKRADGGGKRPLSQGTLVVSPGPAAERYSGGQGAGGGAGAVRASDDDDWSNLGVVDDESSDEGGGGGGGGSPRAGGGASVHESSGGVWRGTGGIPLGSPRAGAGREAPAKQALQHGHAKLPPGIAATRQARDSVRGAEMMRASVAATSAAQKPGGDVAAAAEGTRVVSRMVRPVTAGHASNGGVSHIARPVTAGAMRSPQGHLTAGVRATGGLASAAALAPSGRRRPRISDLS